MAVRSPAALPVTWLRNLMDERWKVTVDRNVCVGSGLCAAAAPEHFRLEHGKSRPVNDLIDPDDVALDAAGTCPAEAIAVYDAAGRQLDPDL